MNFGDIDIKIYDKMQKKTLEIYSIYNKEDINNVIMSYSKVKNTIQYEIIGVKNPFKSLTKVQSILKVSFNFDGSLISYGIYYYMHMQHNRFNTSCNFYYDYLNKLTKIHYFKVDYSDNEDISYTTFDDELNYLDDIETLVNFFFSKENNTILKEILPEYYICGVYDFNSIDFKNRLELAKMYTY